jgi:hypothetical protein
MKNAGWITRHGGLARTLVCRRSRFHHLLPELRRDIPGFLVAEHRYASSTEPLRAKMVTVTITHNPPIIAAKPILTCKNATAIIAADSGSPHANRLASEAEIYFRLAMYT